MSQNCCNCWSPRTVKCSDCGSPVLCSLSGNAFGYRFEAWRSNEGCTWVPISVGIFAIFLQLLESCKGAVQFFWQEEVDPVQNASQKSTVFFGKRKPPLNSFRRGVQRSLAQRSIPPMTLSRHTAQKRGTADGNPPSPGKCGQAILQ